MKLPKKTFKRRLLWLNLANAAAAVLLTLLMFILSDYYEFRQAMPFELRSIAQGIMGSAQASLAPGPRHPVSNTLADVVASHPHITRAALFDATGKVVAEYARGNESPHPLPSARAAGAFFERGRLSLFQDVPSGPSLGGTVYLQSDLADVGLALRPASPLLGPRQGGQQERSEDRDDGDHHQQLDEGEGMETLLHEVHGGGPFWLLCGFHVPSIIASDTAANNLVAARRQTTT